MRSKFKWIFTLLLALSMQFSFAQEKTVTGVVSEGKLPLPGANVLVKGTKNGVQTDFDGKYSIKAKVGDVLVFSYVGMAESTATVGASNTINVAMLENGGTKLEEVVISALNVKKSEKAVGYAQQTVKGSVISEARETNLVNALTGRVAGIQVTNSSGAVGASSRVVLRGNSSITGNNQALFVVDGVPFNNSTSSSATDGGGQDLPNGTASINPDDIESMTVLKGPNAAALYGIRASNGVILITTKKGNKSKGLGVASFNTTVMFQDPLLLPSFQNSYGQGTDQGYFQYVNGAGAGYADGVDESWGPALDRGLEFVQWNSYTVGGAPLPWVSHPDNVKDFYETGTSFANTLSLAAGDENTNFRMSLGNSAENGMVPNTELNKYTVNVNGNIKLGDHLSSGVTFMYMVDQSDQIPTGGYNNENPAQQFIWSARNVDFKELKNWQSLPLAPEGTASAGTPLNWNNVFQNNPYWLLDTNLNTYDRNRITGSAFATYQIAKGLSATGTVQLDQFAQEITNRQAIGSNSNAAGSYAVTNLNFTELNTQFLLAYQSKFSDNVSYNINFGANDLKSVQTQLFGAIDALELPNFYNLSNNKTGSTPRYANTYNEVRIGSVYYFGQVAYKSIFFFDFTGRNDWASVLPAANNSFFYPSFSGSFVLSELVDTKSANIDFVKIRGGWSKVGGVGALGAYNLNQTYALVNNGWGIQAQTPNIQYNPNLTPEQVIGTEVGLELNAFNNRLRFAGTLYSKQSSDLLVAVDVSASSGFLQSWSNAGEMSNKGVEIQLGGTVIQTSDFSFDIDLNFAKNNNEVISLGGLDSYELGGQWGVSLQAIPGQPLGSIVGRDFNRDSNGNVIYENGLPTINNQQQVIGNIAPDFTGGANFTFNYKNFSFGTLIDCKVGGDVHSMTNAWGNYAGTLENTLVGRETGLVGNGVMSDGNGGYVPNDVVVPAKSFFQTAYGNDVESSSVFSATYVKLRQMSLGYNFPQNWLNGTSISEFKFSLVARNIAILYKEVPNIDPETGFSNANGNQGQEFGQVPSAVSYGFNINVKF